MRIRMKKDRTAAGASGIYRENAIVDVSQEEGEQLIAAGVAVFEGPPADETAADAPADGAAAASEVEQLKAQMRELGEQLAAAHAAEQAAKRTADEQIAEKVAEVLREGRADAETLRRENAQLRAEIEALRAPKGGEDAGSTTETATAPKTDAEQATAAPQRKGRKAAPAAPAAE